MMVTPTARRPEMALGEGERREADARRRRFLVLGCLFAAGLFSGFYIGHTDPASLFDAEARWSPLVSLVLTGIFLAAMIGGSLALRGSMDELQRQTQYKAVSLAGAVYMLVYPSWFMLWKGGFVAEPAHGPLFILFWLSLATASVWYRFR